MPSTRTVTALPATRTAPAPDLRPQPGRPGPPPTPPASQVTSPGGLHVVGLDGLRAVAVAGVLASHFLARTVAWHEAGAMGVRLFFVLSGFLITGILLRCRVAVEAGRESAGFTLRQFYARRFLRIFPLYYAALAVAWRLDVSGARATILWHATYLSNVRFTLTGEWQGSLSHFWSLAVEEQFYLVWPVLALFIPRAWLGRVIGATICSAVLFRLVCMFAQLPDMAMMTLPFGAVDSLGVGSLLAVHAAGRDGRTATAARSEVPRWLVVGAPIALVYLAAELVVTNARPPRAVWVASAALHDTAVSLVFGAVVLAVAHRRGAGTRLLEWAPLAYLGRISYGIYVIHLLVPPVLGRVAWRAGVTYEARRGLAFFALNSAITVLAAAASWHFFEAPLNALKRYFPYERAGRASRHG